MTAIVALLSTLPILLAGDFCYQLFRNGMQKTAFAERWSLALALGAGFVTLIHFGILQVWQQRSSVQKWLEDAPLTRLTYSNGLILGLVLIFFCIVYLVAAQAGLGHDGYAFWGFKAKVIFGEGGWPPPIGRLATAAHPDYPLLVPTLEAWIYWFLGEVNEAAVKIVFVLFYAALIFLYFSIVRQKYGLVLSFIFTALMALTPQLAAVSVLSGYADVPLMLYVWGTAVLCLRWLENGNLNDLLLGGTLAALAIWVKREGAVYYAVNTGLIVLTTGWLAMHSQTRKLPIIALYLAPGLLILTPWFYYLHYWQIPNSDFAAFSISELELYVSRLPVILTMLGTELFFTLERWGLLWWLFLASLALKSVRQKAFWYLMILTLLPVAALNLAFVLSSWQPFTTHIAVSLERLILHVVPLAWYLIALQSTGLNQWLANMVKQE